MSNSAMLRYVPSINTYDADATAADIVLDKTAYVDGEKLTGTLVGGDMGILEYQVLQSFDC